MKNFFTALIFVFLLSPFVKAETPGLTTVWKKTISEVNYIATGGQKSMAIHNGDLYIPNNGTPQKIDVISTVDASLKKTITPATAFTSAWALNCIAFTDDGVMITGSTQIGGTNLYLYRWNDLDAGTYTALPLVPVKGRLDFFAFRGNIDGEAGGYVAGATVSTQGNLNIAPMSNGAVGTMTTYENFALFGAGASLDFIDESTVVYGAQNVGKTIYKLDTNTATVVKGAGTAGSSVAYFKFKGYDYVVSAENRFGALKILDITDGAANAVVLHTTADLGAGANASIATPICIDIQSDYVMIYVFAVNNGIAAYKFIPEKQVAEVVVTPVITPESGEYVESVNVTIATTTPGATIRYTLDGTEPTEASVEYTAPFDITTLGETTVKAKAWLADWTTSEAAQATYTIVARSVVATPVIAPEGGSYGESVNVTISTTTPGATIRYTLDSMEPTETSTEYTGTFVVTKPIVETGSSDITVKAKAWLTNWTASDVAEITYTFMTVGIDQKEMSVLKVYSAGGQIIVETEVATDVEIYNIQGQRIVSDKAVQNVGKYTLGKGAYVVKVQGKSIKVIL